MVGIRLILALLSVFFVAGQQGADQVYAPAEAHKVIQLIERIQNDQLSAPVRENRQVTVSEGEFNSYIAYRIETENEEIMRELGLKFLGGNRIEGKIFIDLKGRNIPKILRPEMTFYFSAVVEVRDARVRLNLDDLFLEGQKIRPELLDLIIMIGSSVAGWDSGGINDWYELPFGIKDIKVYKGYAEFYY